MGLITVSDGRDFSGVYPALVINIILKIMLSTVTLLQIMYILALNRCF